MKRHPTILRQDKTVLLVVDYQEKMVQAMHEPQRVTQAIQSLLRAMKILGIPIVVTEQYPKGLGHTASELQNEVEGATIIEKLSFSCCGNQDFWDTLFELNRTQVLVCGIEAHVCVLQTALDLLANDYQVHIPVTAATSRNPEHYQNALNRLSNEGAVLTNHETAMFELLVRAGTDEFKSVQKLIV